MLLWSVQELSRYWLFLLRRTRCSEQGEAVEPLALLAPNTEAVASAEPQSRTTSSSVLAAAAERPAPADRNTGATASAWRGERHIWEVRFTCQEIPVLRKHERGKTRIVRAHYE